MACLPCLLCYGREGSGPAPRNCEHMAGDDRIIPLGSEFITDGCPGRQISETSLYFIRTCEKIFGFGSGPAPLTLEERLSLPHIFAQALEAMNEFERGIISEMRESDAGE